ncbi:MAG: hypothetical protein KGI78_02625 [Patescibacteria group bacterium]|nr:hypothetical protein [Patescibacteria group bacterium]MDE2057727.1 hypothetical protein [Patescibacteria group bacterium]
MDEQAVKRVHVHWQIPIPHDVGYRERYSHMRDNAARAGRIRWEKYGRIGDESRRRAAWMDWWNAVGKFKHSGAAIAGPIPIRKPRRSSELAEFCGIMLGDGGISNRQVSITLHGIDDRAYGVFVKKLMYKLFGIIPARYMKKDCRAFALVVSRTELVTFLTEDAGLVRGNKVRQAVDIPDWIKANPDYAMACLRGLVDTDGCIFTHRYRVKGTQYSYKKLSFTNASDRLRLSAARILSACNLYPRLTPNSVRLDRKDDVARYLNVIGSHNPKHLKRARQ